MTTHDSGTGELAAGNGGDKQTNDTADDPSSRRWKVEGVDKPACIVESISRFLD